MFKRIEKRRIRNEEKESLGDLKDILGMDTDSDESDSDSDHSEGSSDRGLDVEEEEEESETLGEDELPTITVREALEDPVYVVSIDPDIRLCALCPGKLLKTTEMVTLHKRSDAHLRRWKKFQSTASACDPDANVSTLVLATPDHISSGVSKRAQKRKARKDALVAKRKRTKSAKAAKKDSHPKEDLTKAVLQQSKEEHGAEKKSATASKAQRTKVNTKVLLNKDAAKEILLISKNSKKRSLLPAEDHTHPDKNLIKRQKSGHATDDGKNGSVARKAKSKKSSSVVGKEI